jgi:enoyl-CoA hydratase/carnithine racemase
VPDVVVETRGSIGCVRLNRPNRGNSVTPEVVTEMGNAVGQFGRDDAVGAIILTGTGSVFCAGADVQAMYEVHLADGADGLMDYLAQVWMPAVQQTVRKLWSCPKPIVAAINGAATAGGLDFALSCDMRVATTSARFAESYVNLGMVPVAGGVFLLPRAIGASAALDLLATGRIVDSAEAEKLRLVDRVCEPADLEKTADQLAEILSRPPAATVTEIKQVARAAATAELEMVLDASYRANVELMKRDDVRSRILAVMERFSIRN